MNTFLLLAGQSTRFWPLTEKSFFPVCGKTMLAHQVERLHAGGCAKIIFIGGPHNLPAARKMFPELPAVEQEDVELGMRGAVLSALKKYGTDPLMIVSGNDVIEPSAYAALLRTAGDGAILASKVKHYFPGGYLTVDHEKITGIVEKPGEGKEPSDLVNIVAHMHRDPAALQAALIHIDAGKDDGYERALATLFKEKTYTAVSYTGAWRAVKYPWNMIDLLEMLLAEIPAQSIHPTAEIHPSATITGNVVIDAGARVFENAVIRGPCTIGKNAIVAGNALVRESSIGERSVIGFCTEVKASVIGNDVWTHMNYIGESVIGNNVGLGGGTITGNLRLDEQEIASDVHGEKVNTHRKKFGTVIGADARIGIHVSINPGIKIGAGSFVSSAVLLERDIPDGTFAYMKNGELQLKKNHSLLKNSGDRGAFREKL